MTPRQRKITAGNLEKLKKSKRGRSLFRSATTRRGNELVGLADEAGLPIGRKGYTRTHKQMTKKELEAFKKANADQIGQSQTLQRQVGTTAVAQTRASSKRTKALDQDICRAPAGALQISLGPLTAIPEPKLPIKRHDVGETKKKRLDRHDKEGNQDRKQ